MNFCFFEFAGFLSKPFVVALGDAEDCVSRTGFNSSFCLLSGNNFVDLEQILWTIILKNLVHHPCLEIIGDPTFICCAGLIRRQLTIFNRVSVRSCLDFCFLRGSPSHLDIWVSYVFNFQIHVWTPYITKLNILLILWFWGQLRYVDMARGSSESVD